MFRHIQHLLSLICLPLAVLVVIMWARSYYMLDRLTYRSVDNQDCHLRSDFGHVTWFWTTPVFPNRHVLPQLTASVLPSCSRLIAVWESLGFHHEFEQIPAAGLRPGMARSLTMVPYWFLFLVFGAVPGWRGMGWGRTVAFRFHRRWEEFKNS